MEVQPAGFFCQFFRKIGPLALRRLLARLRNHAGAKRKPARRRTSRAVIDDNRVHLNVGFERHAQQLALRVLAMVVHPVRNSHQGALRFNHVERAPHTAANIQHQPGGAGRILGAEGHDLLGSLIVGNDKILGLQTLMVFP